MDAEKIGKDVTYVPEQRTQIAEEDATGNSSAAVSLQQVSAGPETSPFPRNDHNIVYLTGIRFWLIITS